MIQNLTNALHGVQEARSAIFLETGTLDNTEAQEEALEAIQGLLNEVEALINGY